MAEMAEGLTIGRIHGRDAEQARGIVVVIDVLRAFTVSAYAFAGGARKLMLVRTVDEALALRANGHADAILAGEVDGRFIPGFDLNNSPVMMQAADVHNRLVIQRTSAGTQGAVNARHATRLLVASLVNARATVAHALELAEADTVGQITLVPTAPPFEEQGWRAMEDDVCADYLEALLRGRSDAETVLAQGIEEMRANNTFDVYFQGWEDLSPDDVPAALAANRFGFAMEGERRMLGEIEYITVRRVDAGLGTPEARASNGAARRDAKLPGA